VSGVAGFTRASRLPVLALLVANTTSLVGDALTMVALPWFVLETTSSAALTGLAGFAFLLPGVVAGVFGGALVDRLGFKRTSVVADVVGSLAVAAIPLLHHTVGLAFWQLLGLAFLGALLDVPGVTARRSLLPELAQLAGMRLERVNAAYEANQQLALLLGPPLAGALIAWLGASTVLWLDAATFAASAGVVALAVPDLAGALPTATEPYRAALAAGLRYLRRERLLLALAVSLGLLNLVLNPLFAVVLPVYARDELASPPALGLMLGFVGIGALAGAVGYGAVGHRFSRRRTWLASFLLIPLAYWVLVPAPPLAVLLPALALAGLAKGPIGPIALTVRQERIPPELRGRVLGASSAIALATAPLGVAIAGFLVESAGFRPTVLVLAAGAQLLGLGMLLVPVFRDLDGWGAAGAARPAPLAPGQRGRRREQRPGGHRV
jgi:MFS family permease